MSRLYYLSSLSLIAIIFLFPMGALPAGEAEKLPFEPDDTLEEIRYKIDYNGYDFTVSDNHIFRMSEEEKATLLGKHRSRFPGKKVVSTGPGPLIDQLGKKTLPSNFDWRSYNGHSYIGAIQDQGDCGACYAFGAAAAAEGTYNWANGLYDGNRIDFSEAFIAFCLSDHYSAHFDGCDGADYDYYELEALVQYGICTAALYPYTDHSQSCPFPTYPAVTKFQSWHRVDCNDIDAIKTAIMTYGVVDVAVYSTSAFQAYESGVFEDSYTTCPGSPCYYTDTNHAVSLVGWDDNPPEGGGGCWILRNSYGTGWGEIGYMRIRYTSARVACEVTYLVSGGSDYHVLAGGDYNGDTYDDIAIFRPSSGLWSVRNITRCYFGGSSDDPAPGDYDGDGTTDIAIFRDSSGLWSYTSGGVARRLYYGQSGDTSVPGDYNGDGTCDVAIFRPSTGLWALNYYRCYFGGSSDIPIPGDYNGDGTSEPGIFRAASGLWSIRGVTRLYFGGAADTPVPGWYIGTRHYSPGIYRASSGLWAIRDVTRCYFGGSSDQPVPADFNDTDGDDIAIFRQSTGLWAVRGWTRCYFGASGDIPVTK